MAEGPDAGARRARPTKHVADSLTEAMRIVAHPDVNGENRLFGGRLME